MMPEVYEELTFYLTTKGRNMVRQHHALGLSTHKHSGGEGRGSQGATRLLSQSSRVRFALCDFSGDYRKADL